MDFVSILLDALLVAVWAAVAFVFRAVCKTSEQRRFVREAVTAAEQLFGSAMGKEKFSYVSKMLDERWKLTEEQKEVLIEAAVGDLSGVWLGETLYDCDGEPPEEGFDAE